MKPWKFLFLIILLVLPVYLYATEPPERIEKVIATGIGIDADKARQNAIRNAVEQVIGSYVSSDTIVQNNAILKDDVLNYSGGYVKESKLLSQEKSDDGLFSVKLEAYVISTKLKRKLESLNVATKKVEGESLFGEAFSKVEEKKSSGELLGKILAKYPQAAYVYEVGKPEIESTSSGANKANITIPISIKWDQSFLAELKETLKHVATEERKSISLFSIDSKSSSGVKGYPKGTMVVCFSPRSPLRSERAETCYFIDQSDQDEQGGRKIKRRAAKSDGAKINSLTNLPRHAADMPMINIALKDKAGTTIDAASYRFKASDNDGVKKQGIQYNGNKFKDALDNIWFQPPNILWRENDDAGGGHILILTDGMYRLNVKTSIDIGILKDIAKMEISMDSWGQ